MREFLETSERTFLPAQHWHPLSHTDFLSHLKAQHSQIWPDYFHSHISPHSAYFRIQPTLPNKPWFTNFPHFSRKSIVTITRLRFNHRSLPANLTRFISDISPFCTLHPDTVTLATPNHIFFQCPNQQSQIKSLEQILTLAGAQRPWSLPALLVVLDPLIFYAIYEFITHLPPDIKI